LNSTSRSFLPEATVAWTLARVVAVEQENDPKEVGQLVTGRVKAVFHWGIIVDLGLPFVGLIDVLYIGPTDLYVIGDQIAAHLDGFDERKKKYILRPPGQVPVIERLRLKGIDIEDIS